MTLVCLQPSTMQNLGKLACRLVVPLESWLVGCDGAEVAATPSLSPSPTKISFTSAPTLPSPKKLVSCRGFLPIYLLSGRCHALHRVNTAQYAGINWGLLGSQMVSHEPPLWGTGEKNPPLPGCATTATAALLTRWIIHAQVVTVCSLHGIKETSGLEAHSWFFWHFCLPDGFLRALRAAKEIKSSQQQQAVRTFESGAFVGGRACRWKAQLSLSLGCFWTRWELSSWGPISGWASSVTWCE